MEGIDELLPGIEEYLSETLASEKLSPFAEQRRLFFLERLDIVKLPPTVPPREGRNLSQELLKDTEEKSGIPSSQKTTRQQPDFAATQREISRGLRGAESHVGEEREEVHDGDDDSSEEVKVYDDIDIPDDSFTEDTEQKERRSVDNPYDGEDIDDQDHAGPNNVFLHHQEVDDDDDNGENDYEIPVAMQQLSDHGGSHPSLPMVESTEELRDDVIESAAVTMGPPPVPPPLPPRRDIRFSDSGSRSSINGTAEEAPPDLPFRPSLSKKGEICGRSERSDRSDPDASGDGDSTSYESFDDEDEDPNNCSSKSNPISQPNKDTLSRNADIKLPAKPSKKKTLKMSKKMPKSKSLSQWEISAPFRKLDNVDVSGELLHKGKLTWNRRLVAISNGCLAMYKPDKDGRPMAVIPLMGYDATVTERKEKGRAFEIKMTHPQDDTHLFSVDVKEWAYAWKEHINSNSRGQRSSAGHTVRLSRALSGDLGIITPGTGTLAGTSSNTGSHGSKTDLNGSNSNLSTGSEGGRQEEVAVRPRLRSGNKVMRMGSFAFRATQFFENISKKTSVKRKQSTQSFAGEAGSNTNNNAATNSTAVSKSQGGSLDSEECPLIGNDMKNSNSNHSNILEESSISSNSTSNPSHSPFNSPTSDLNAPVFSDNNSSPSNSPTAVSSPGFDATNTRHGSLSNEGISVNDHHFLQDVSHKGYLFIFSTFNRRRWGKRFCLVRGNYFECYRTENQPASQCELSFLLKACVMRRAVLETGSELALMLVEVDTHKEKITVEPVNDDEMSVWVQVLMSETSTPFLPEGLEDHMKSIEARRGSECPSLLSMSVLKQWDMDITLQSMGTSPKENTSPEEEDAPPSWQIPENDTSSPAETLTPTPSDVNLEELPTFQKESSGSPIPDNFVAHITMKKKHTTDSGFYSVKGNNSDSDGEHVDSVHTINDMQTINNGIDLNCGFSVVESHNYNHSKQCSENSNIHQSNDSDDASKATTLSPQNSLPQTCINTPGERLCESLPSNTCLSSPPTPSSFLSQQPSPEPTSPFHAIPPALPATQTDSPHSPKTSTPEMDCNNSTTSTTEPHVPKDEYTLVIKRSLRRKPKPVVNNASCQNHTLTQNCELNNDSHESSSTCINDLITSVIENTSPSDVMTFGSPNSDEEVDGDEPPPLPPSEPIYEVIETDRCAGDIITDADSVFLPNHTSMRMDESKEHPHNLQCNEDRFDHLIQSLEEEKINLQNRPSTSSISNIIDSNMDDSVIPKCIESQNQISDDSTVSNVNGIATTTAVPTASSAVVAPSKLSVTLISDEITACKSTITPISIRSISVSEYNNDAPTSALTSSPQTPTCHSPELPMVEVHKPGMTEGELREAIEGLKQKKSHLKRKRLAVHDKRQRVSSDEERLACEKEFASLERAVENTDNDIGFLQNQLDALCGHSLEAIKINNKKKPGSGKKKKSKKKAH